MSALSADYLAALRLHDQDGLAASLQSARQLGATAVGKRLGPLERAKIQETSEQDAR